MLIGVRVWILIMKARVTSQPRLRTTAAMACYSALPRIRQRTRNVPGVQEILRGGALSAGDLDFLAVGVTAVA